MSERKDLIAICEMFNISLDWNSKTDADILKSIVAKLNSLETNHEKFSVPDSLAFPQSARDLKGVIEDKDLWNELEQFHQLLQNDYTCRRQMLLNRLDCTVESFKWKASKTRNPSNPSGDSRKQGTEGKESLNDRIHQMYDTSRAELKPQPNVKMAHLLALRESDCDKLLNSVVSSRSNDCQVNYKNHKNRHTNLVNLKQIIIPDVPDRGGRTDDIGSPPRETYSHQQRYGRGRGGRR